MGLLSLLGRSPLAFVVIAAALVMSMTLREYARAAVADRLGDGTPRRLGRLTLNPLAHIDPIGLLFLLILGFGYGRAVPLNYAALGRWGGLWVALAGPLTNLLIALLCALVMRFAPPSALLDIILATVASVNVMLAVFNLLPLPMLDGSRIVAALFPRTLGRSLAEFEAAPYSGIAVMLVILLGQRAIGQLIAAVQGWLFAFAGVGL